MMTIKENSRKIPVFAKSEVLVCGGGPSGVCAAIGSARTGAGTLLVERYGFFGGTATAALVGPMQTFHAGKEQVVEGIPQEIVDKMMRLGGSPGHVPDLIGFASTITPFDAETFKYVAQIMLLKEKVNVLLHTFICGTIIEKGRRGLERVKGIVIENKSGRQAILADVVVDTTGDGDVCARGGASFEIGREQDGLTQPMTMVFRMGAVNTEKLWDYMKKHRSKFILNENLFLKLAAKREVPRYLAVVGFFDEVQEEKKQGRFPIQRDRVLFFSLPRPGEVLVNMTRITEASGCDGVQLTLAELQGREQVFTAVRFLTKRIPGFEKSYLIQTSTQIGIRETRRITGDYILNEHELLAGKKFPDVIARGGYPIDIHDPSGGGLTSIKMPYGTSYDIPSRCLFAHGFENLLVAGRCASTTHQAHAATRVTPIAMAMGQAAGVIAGLCVRKKTVLRRLKTDEIQTVLLKQKANLG